MSALVIVVIVLVAGALGAIARLIIGRQRQADPASQQEIDEVQRKVYNAKTNLYRETHSTQSGLPGGTDWV